MLVYPCKDAAIVIAATSKRLAAHGTHLIEICLRYFPVLVQQQRFSSFLSQFSNDEPVSLLARRSRWR